MSSSAQETLSKALDAAVISYERVHLMKGISIAASHSEYLFHQSWIKMLWNTVYDSTIICLGTLLDRSDDSHGLCRVAEELRTSGNLAENLQLACDLELAVDRTQSPYQEIILIRNARVAHNTAKVTDLQTGPPLAKLSKALDEIFSLLARSSRPLGLPSSEIDLDSMRNYQDQTVRLLVFGMRGTLPTGVVRAANPSASSTQ